MIHKVRALFNALKNIDLLLQYLYFSHWGDSLSYSWYEKSLHSCHQLSVTFYQLNCLPDFLSNSFCFWPNLNACEVIICSTVIYMRFIFKAVMKFENHRFWSLLVSRQGNQVKNNSNILQQIKVLFLWIRPFLLKSVKKFASKFIVNNRPYLF